MSRGKILVIDDDPAFLMVAKKELGLAGYAVQTSETGRAALALLDHDNFDLIYTDLVMPDMDGVAVCRAIKERKPALPVFLISAHHDKVLQQHLDFLKAGGRDKYLRKPLEKGELAEETNAVMAELHRR